MKFDLKSVSIALFLGLTLGACGTDVDVESKTEEYTYSFNHNGCKTGDHKFGSKDAYCTELQDSGKNNHCAYAMRKNAFEQNCNGTFAETNPLPPPPAPSAQQKNQPTPTTPQLPPVANPSRGRYQDSDAFNNFLGRYIVTSEKCIIDGIEKKQAVPVTHVELVYDNQGELKLIEYFGGSATYPLYERHEVNPNGSGFTKALRYRRADGGAEWIMEYRYFRRGFDEEADTSRSIWKKQPGSALSFIYRSKTYNYHEADKLLFESDCTYELKRTN